MELTKKQFDILEILAGKDSSLTQRELKDITGFSLGSVNKTVKELSDQGLIKNGCISSAGTKVLSSYKVKRAIIIAAGFGSRMVPLTFNTPKPLIRVNGVRIIDGIIDACLEAGIDDIYVVRGYLYEQFDQLLYKYPMLKFVENPQYKIANNISSIMCVRHLLQSAYILDADLIIDNPKLIKPYQYESNFLGIYRERTDDWCFEVEHGIITEHKIGGLGCYQQVGISFWSPSDGARLEDDIKRAYESPGGKELYWEESATKMFKDSYKIHIRECGSDEITEIDSYEDLKLIDSTYIV